MLKQGLELKQQQKLSPLQIQTIKLIELPVQELEQRIRKELEENPVLDEDISSDKEEDEAPREVSLSEYKDDDPIPSYRLRADNYSKDERPQYSTFSVKESFTQSLQEQLGYRNLTEHQYFRPVRGLFYQSVVSCTFVVWELQSNAKLNIILQSQHSKTVACYIFVKLVVHFISLIYFCPL